MNRKLKMEELGRLEIDDFQQVEKWPIVLVLDNVRSALNIGSAFRTADAFRIEEIILTGCSAQPPNNEIRKTAIGATDAVAWKYFNENQEAIEYLNQKGYTIAVVEQTTDSISLSDFRPKEKTALVFGHEVRGVSDEFIKHAETCIEIPQHGTKHSLNISVSVGVVLWDCSLKLKIQ